MIKMNVRNSKTAKSDYTISETESCWVNLNSNTIHSDARGDAHFRGMVRHRESVEAFPSVRAALGEYPNAKKCKKCYKKINRA